MCDQHLSQSRDRPRYQNNRVRLNRARGHRPHDAAIPRTCDASNSYAHRCRRHRTHATRHRWGTICQAKAYPTTADAGIARWLVHNQARQILIAWHGAHAQSQSSADSRQRPDSGNAEHSNAYYRPSTANLAPCNRQVHADYADVLMLPAVPDCWYNAPCFATHLSSKVQAWEYDWSGRKRHAEPKQHRCPQAHNNR